MRSGDEVAGPRVQTIFARRVTPIRLVSLSRDGSVAGSLSRFRSVDDVVVGGRR